MNRPLLSICLLAALSAQPGAGFQRRAGRARMTPMGKSPIRVGVSGSCLYCHAPHSAMAGPATPLWNQQLSVQSYTSYTSSTFHQTGIQPPLGSPTKLCLSCHDGTSCSRTDHSVRKVGYERVDEDNLQVWRGSSQFASSEHEDSAGGLFRDQCAAFLCVTEHGGCEGSTREGHRRVHHVPRSAVQGKDHTVPMFLVRDNTRGALCLACHDPSRVVTGKVNYLSNWAISAHATATNQTSNQPYVGG